MSSRTSCRFAVRYVFGPLAVAALCLLGACADGGGGYSSSGPATQYGSGAPDLNCQFGSPCANARGSRY